MTERAEQLGRIEGKLDILLTNQDTMGKRQADMDVRVISLEKFQARLGGMVAIIATVFTLIGAYAKEILEWLKGGLIG
jgi:hypothetical protein